MQRKNIQIISGAVVFRDTRRKRYFLVVKHNEGDKWELPKISIRKTESSVRAALRMMEDMASMETQVLEEAGRATGVATINNRVVPQKYLYYLMIRRDGGKEIIGFADAKWMEYAKAIRALSLKREQEALRGGKKALREWEKKQETK